MAQRVRSHTFGDLVNYIGLSVQIAQPGELGIVVDLVDTGRSAGMVEVEWIDGTSSYCWPSELEHA